MQTLKTKLEIEKPQKLEQLLTEGQIEGIQTGSIIALADGQKIKPDDNVKGTVLIISPLKGG